MVHAGHIDRPLQKTSYAALYALETLAQLMSHVPGHVVHEDIALTDAPMYDWRGLMLDSGRRFFPVPLVKNLMETMVAAKLNVLHLHASDHCRVGGREDWAWSSWRGGDCFSTSHISLNSLEWRASCSRT